MHETRNFAMVVLLIAGLIWSVFVWLVHPVAEPIPLAAAQRTASLLLVVSMAGWLLYAFCFEDKLPDNLGQVVGGMYYDVDGLSFMPTIRNNRGQAELCVYYQNRYENPAQVIVHLRPPEHSIVIRPGARDVHFAFMAGGGDFGVIHQPFAVPSDIQGQVVEVQLAAASFYPRSHGARLRHETGMPCGTMLVDWGGAAFRSGVHEVSGEMPLKNPATLHLSMPIDVEEGLSGQESWRQERLAAGVEV